VRARFINREALTSPGAAGRGQDKRFVALSNWTELYLNEYLPDVTYYSILN